MVDALHRAMLLRRVLVVALYASPIVALCTCGPAPHHTDTDPGPGARASDVDAGPSMSLVGRARVILNGLLGSDGGVTLDGGSNGGPVDAGVVVAVVDAGASVVDAGTTTPHDAGTTDAGNAVHDAGPPQTVGPDGGCEMVESDPADEGHNHVDAGSLVVYQSNPPASGNHWPIWAKYRVHDEEVPRQVYLHNLEHGAIALIAGPNASPDVIAQLQAVYDAIPVDVYCLQYQSSSTPRALMLTDPDLDDAVAVVAWDHILSGSCVNPDQIQAFVQAHRGKTTEHICADGPWPYPPGVWPDHINDIDGGGGGMQQAPDDAGP